MIKVRSCSSQVKGESVGAVDCSMGCWQNILTGNGDSGNDDDDNNNISSYEEEWSFLSELMTSY